jgi:hypothetical protein
MIYINKSLKYIFDVDVYLDAVANATNKASDQREYLKLKQN